MDRHKRILVVIYLTANSVDALQHGVALAKTFNAELTALRIISNPVDMEAVNVPELFWKGEEIKKYLSVRDQYKEDLEKAIKHVVREGFPVKALISDKEPIHAILETVREEKIDLIVLLAHEEGPLEHLLFGAQNHALIRKLPCSIFLVKHEPKSVAW